MPRPLKPLELSHETRQEVEAWANSLSLSHSLVRRAKIILLSADGMSNSSIASKLDVSITTVGKWRNRFIADGMNGLHDEYRSGRPRTHDDEKVAELLKKTLESKPEGETHWSCRSMADEIGISKSTVNRIWKTFSVKPHKRKGFKLSTDPFFVDKVKDVVGLYLNPPDNAIVLAVDEKSQCQALERTQPILPMGFGYAEGATDNYFRHGTTTLFAALDIATGKVEASCKKRHRHQEFIQFLNQINKNVPKELNVHVILDNYSTHKHEKVKAWLIRHPRFEFHFTPTYSSWLNQVERWFGLITDKTIRRGNFKSTKQLVEKIDEFVQKHNQDPKPFTWTAAAEEILEKIRRLCIKLTDEN
ncbi:MAG: IS630 family transposase [Saccharospirillaceae bacterium]|nr:IS630 family transposase [Saccharospirillaceae bacterium]